MVETEKILKWGLIGGVTLFGGYMIYQVLKSQGIITEVPQTETERTQTVSTGGVTQTFRPRTTYYLGNSGSTREVENHIRAEQITPWWRTYGSAYGSILPEQVTGTFG